MTTEFNFDGYVEGPLGASSGFQCVAAWRDAAGFHRMYAAGFDSKESAREAATQGAKDLGYVEPKRWQFWKSRISYE